ncbi:YchE family NAAT transporter [Buchnera aphidicola]|uniref:YchE family NAAT transporter n=1 Tax=Buchnera aphidicola TaxID=9 RepID=UPI002543E366|nr:YchE family NAAT transporter [Buchnera aphidicola]WII23857.1 YchE family NAAT transporter [Buchnera aphidicola (Sipha maydis)]
MNTLHCDFLIYIKFFFNLFILVNPIGMIPIFTSMTNRFSDSERQKINFTANLSACIILCISLLLGKFILNFFGISLESFRISGGILILIIAISMIHNKNFFNKNKKKQKKISSDIAIIPLSIPLIAGPGTISSTILWGTKNTHFINTFLCILVICMFFSLCYIIFKLSPCFIKILGNLGIKIITKIMGILLLGLGIEFITSGIKAVV